MSHFKHDISIAQRFFIDAISSKDDEYIIKNATKIRYAAQTVSAINSTNTPSEWRMAWKECELALLALVVIK